MGNTVELKPLSVKMARALEIMKENGGVMFAADIAEQDAELFEHGAASVSPLLTHLVKYGLVDRLDKADRAVIDSKTGDEVIRQYVTYKVSDFGATAAYETKA